MAQTAPDDYRDLFTYFEEEGLEWFVTGGQAVNAWAEYFLESVSELEKLRPFQSSDCDVCVKVRSLRVLQKSPNLPGSLKSSSSPLEGQLAILKTNESPPRVIDFLQNVFGLDLVQSERAYQRALNLDGMRVMDPIFLFKGKCHNFISLPQGPRQDWHHLRILQLVLPAYLHYLVNQAVAGEIPERDLIREIKMLLRFEKDQQVRGTMKKLGSELADLVPWKILESSGLSRLSRFAEHQQELEP